MKDIEYMKPLTKEEFLEKLKNDREFNEKYGRKPVKNKMALPPCHYAAQFRVINGKLNCMLVQRSGDSFLGIPFNIASYSLLTHILARECNLEVGDFVHTIGDAHIYHNHFDQVREQLSRTEYPLPQLKIEEEFSIKDLTMSRNFVFPIDSVDKFKLVGYNSHSTIKAEMAV